MFSADEATLVSDGLASFALVSIDTPPFAAAAALDAAGASALADWDVLEVMGVLYNTQHTCTKAIRPYRVHSPYSRCKKDTGHEIQVMTEVQSIRIRMWGMWMTEQA